MAKDSGQIMEALKEYIESHPGCRLVDIYAHSAKLLPAVNGGKTSSDIQIFNRRKALVDSVLISGQFVNLGKQNAHEWFSLDVFARAF